MNDLFVESFLPRTMDGFDDLRVRGREGGGREENDSR